MGDLSHLIPVCHPYASGAVGAGHSKDYVVEDYEAAVVNPAKIMAMVVIDLLAEGAVKGKEVSENHRPAMTKQCLIRFLAFTYAAVPESRFLDYSGPKLP